MKERMNQYRKPICIAIALLISFLLTGLTVRKMELNAKVQKTQEHLAQEVFRFHVLANSDSEEDQELKLVVKSGIIEYMKEQLPDVDSAEETKTWAMEHEDNIREAAEAIIREEGYGYSARVTVTTCYFPDKTYGDVTFPAGEYEALRVEIGKGAGKNWWCVLYPNLCFTDAAYAVVSEEGKEELQEVLTDDEYEMVTATTEFKIKWYFFGDSEEE